MNMEEKLELIFDFLSENRKYNKDLQEKSYKSVVFPHSTQSDKVKSLLYHCVNTQSQPRIDELAKFYRFIHRHPRCLTSFKAFVKKIRVTEGYSYNDLYCGLKLKQGWGNKTSALFTKSIFQLHSGSYDRKLRLWKDAPRIIGEQDRLYLPVDVVILRIFEEIRCASRTFVGINNELWNHYKGPDLEVWDDLWFWGFVTQKGTGSDRKLQWNLNKYWSLEHSNKNGNVVKTVERRAKNFLTILEKCRY